MRIALVVERFGPWDGGVERAAWNVARELVAAGDHVHVIARESRDVRDLGPADRLQVHRVEVPSTWQPTRVTLFSRRAAACLDEIREPLDLVHGFTRVQRQDVYRAGAGSHADFLLQTHGKSGARWRALSPRHRVLLRAERRLIENEDVFVQCVSRRVQSELVARYRLAPARTHVLHNGVDCRAFHPRVHAREGRALREALTDRDGPVWLLVGSGARRKGIDTALSALAASGRPSTELWIAGRDDPKPWQRRAAALGLRDRVRFLGPRADMPRVFAAADGLLLPTRYDPFSNACLEAAASGLPVISTRANGAMELLESAGRVVDDPGDVEGFATALDDFADPALRRAAGEAGRKIAEEHDWPIQVERLRGLYRDRIGASPARRSFGART